MSRTGTSLERLNQAHRRRSQQAQVQEIRDRHAGRLRDLERAATARIAQETEAREQIATERNTERRQHEQEIAQLRADNAQREREVRQAREDLAREQADRADELAQIQYQAAAPTTTPAPNPGQPPTPPGPAVQPMEDGPGFRLPNPEPFTGDVGKAKTFLLQLQSKINGEPKLRNDHGLQISYASLLLRNSAAEWALGYKGATEGTLEWDTVEDFLKDFRHHFIDPNPVGTALSKLEAMTQGRSEGVAQYVARIWPVIIESGVDKRAGKQYMFRGLPNKNKQTLIASAANISDEGEAKETLKAYRERRTIAPRLPSYGPRSGVLWPSANGYRTRSGPLKTRGARTTTQAGIMQLLPREGTFREGMPQVDQAARRPETTAVLLRSRRTSTPANGRRRVAAPGGGHRNGKKLMRAGAKQGQHRSPKSRGGPSRTATSPAPDCTIFVNRFSILSNYDSKTKDEGLPTVTRVMLQKSKVLEQRGTLDVRGFQSPLQILIDTGAEYSLIDQRFVEKHEVPSEQRLKVAL
ncbi:MAG: hypothetical protein M1816_006583 [Peltula sp. TS41687]|nr:MAG: hypothetical protein M1816_006583 [Peltula sp. TS41687]